MIIKGKFHQMKFLNEAIEEGRLKEENIISIEEEKYTEILIVYYTKEVKNED